MQFIYANVMVEVVQSKPSAIWHSAILIKYLVYGSSALKYDAWDVDYVVGWSYPEITW